MVDNIKILFVSLQKRNSLFSTKIVQSVFYFNYHRVVSLHPFSRTVSGFRNQEKATPFLFIDKLFFTMMRNPENNCPTANECTCAATSRAYEKAVKELLSHDTPENFQQTLMNLFFDWIQSDSSSDTSQRKEVTGILVPINQFFQNIKSI